MFMYRNRGINFTNQHESNLLVLNYVWRDEYIDGYRSLSYPQSKVFCQILYWKVIREYLIHSRGRCESNQCQRPWAGVSMYGSDAAEIHHNQYRIHGEEHRRLDTLCVLHRECHQACHPEGRNALEDYW